VYFDPAKHGTRTPEVLASARSALEAGKTVAGDSTLMPAEITGSATDVARSFGEEFERSLRGLPVGSWQGPVRSGFGLRLVRIEDRQDGRPARLPEVRAAVERDLTHARAQAASEAYYEQLRSKYVVRVEDGGASTPPG
jgi:hypothetical protein